MHRYRVFGLNIASEALLPDLRPIVTSAPVDVSIRVAPFDRTADPEPEGLSVSAAGAILNIAQVGRFLIRGGEEILVEPDPAAADRNVRLYLLGSAFGAILHQRGLLPLHANSIDFDGAAIAFMGHSGAGKSTLASWFHDRGRPILGDDVCVLASEELERGGAPIVQPGLPRMRLWGDALQASGRISRDYEQSFDDMDKYDVPTTAADAGPRPLAAIYVLRPADGDQPHSVRRLTGVDAMQALVANTYRGVFVPMVGNVKRHLDQCIALSRRVPVFELHRRWGLDVLAEEAAFIEAHVRQVLDHMPSAA